MLVAPMKSHHIKLIMLQKPLNIFCNDISIACDKGIQIDDSFSSSCSRKCYKDVLVAQRYILISYHMDIFLSYLLDGDGVV